MAKTVYAPNEWRFGVAAETNLGTGITSNIQLLNINDFVTVSTAVAESTDVRSGVGRTVKELDHFIDYKGGAVSTITASIVMDTTVDALLHNNATGTDVDTSPASYDIAFDYAPTAIANGGAAGAAGGLTVALISPQSSETRYFVGCQLTEMTVTMDAATEGGRRQANLTFTTAYAPVFGTTAPSVVAYGTTYRYLRDYAAVKTIAGTEVILNKVEYTIANNATYTGFQGASGNPEYMQRAIPSADVSLMLGVLYDEDTANYWEQHLSGTTQAIVISDNATWASATFGIKADDCKFNAEVQPAGTDAGVFQDLSFMCTASGSGSVIEIVP